MFGFFILGASVTQLYEIVTSRVHGQIAWIEITIVIKYSSLKIWPINMMISPITN